MPLTPDRMMRLQRLVDSLRLRDQLAAAITGAGAEARVTLEDELDGWRVLAELDTSLAALLELLALGAGEEG